MCAVNVILTKTQLQSVTTKRGWIFPIRIDAIIMKYGYCSQHDSSAISHCFRDTRTDRRTDELNCRIIACRCIHTAACYVSQLRSQPCIPNAIVESQLYHLRLRPLTARWNTTMSDACDHAITQSAQWHWVPTCKLTHQASCLCLSNRILDAWRKLSDLLPRATWRQSTSHDAITAPPQGQRSVTLAQRCANQVAANWPIADR